MRKIILILSLSLVGCTPISTPMDSSLDGKILTDEDGNIYKLEWQKGWGATWAFKYPVTRIHNKDTIIEWVYYEKK